MMPSHVPIGPMMVAGPIDMSPSDLEDARSRIPQPQHRSTLLSWQVAATGFATVLVMGWLCVIALLILQERWKLVLVTWILLYAAAHFAYCYCKRNSVTNLKRHLNLRIVGQLREVHISEVPSPERKEDKPPAYVDAVDMEQPPPTYIMAVQYTKNNFYVEENETRRNVTKSNTKNPADDSNSRELILNPQSAVLTSAALPIAMALPFSPSSASLNSLASVHSNKSMTGVLDEPKNESELEKL